MTACPECLTASEHLDATLLIAAAFDVSLAMLGVDVPRLVAAADREWFDTHVRPLATREPA